ncbi:7685_t:CDS:2 [Funneliformis caledonium]|uniref:7685_t:CDS:1 n=1 Tax=Funneliformis caledonium TaxID=1117310 RepID=A0A9N9EZZ3_9GLOM|nr:7685_t:CDS:2 [Funneliformis caledonium]
MNYFLSTAHAICGIYSPIRTIAAQNCTIPPFDVDCQFYDGDDVIYSCNDSLSSPQIFKEDAYPGYFGYFMNKNNLKYARHTTNGDQIIKIKLFSNTSNDLISIYIVDSENNPLKSPDYKIYTKTFQFLDFMKELFANNKYRIANNQLSFIGLTRNQKKIIKPSFSSTLGVNPSYKTEHRIISKFQSTPLPTKPSTGYYSEIEISVTSFHMQVETEKRIRTLLSVDAIRPWGGIQFYYCGYSHRIYNKFKNTMPVLPLINSPSLMTELNSSSPNVKELHDRLISLEIFLKEYVVDVRFLEKSEKMDQIKYGDDK